VRVRQAPLEEQGSYAGRRDSIGLDRRCAVLIGAAYRYSGAPQRPDRRRCRVAEHIVAADGDDCVLWVHGGDERRRRAIGRSMMADFEYIVRMPHVARAWIDNRHVIGAGCIEAIVVCMPAVGLPAVGNLVNAKFA